MAASPATLPNLDLLDAAGLKALILSQHDELVATQQRLLSRESEIEHLKLLIAKLRRMQFGRKSEKLERQIEQLELKLEELESAKASPTERVRPCVLCSTFSSDGDGETGTSASARTSASRSEDLRCRKKRAVPSVAGGCAGWAKTSPKYWSTYRHASR